MRYKEILEACWTGYRQAGMKNKGGRQVPNCVPVREAELEENLRDWFKTSGYVLVLMARFVETVLEVQNLKASPSVCHKPKHMLWAKKVVRQQPEESVEKIPTPTVQERPSMWPLKRNDNRRLI